MSQSTPWRSERRLSSRSLISGLAGSAGKRACFGGAGLGVQGVGCRVQDLETLHGRK